jgi:hypothetical protein
MRSSVGGWVENSRAKPAMPSLNGLMMNSGAVEGFLVAGGVRPRRLPRS